jgi:phosphatidylinositol-4,5-bisphosphate 3-kinase
VRAAGLDLQLRPYHCVATGDEIGMLEVVLDADTTSRISKACLSFSLFLDL